MMAFRGRRPSPGGGGGTDGGRLPLLLALAGLSLFPACAPTFSDLQSARMAGPGRVEVTPSYSSVSYTGGGETEKVQNHVGVQLATGVSEGVDLRLRYEYIDVEGDGIHVLGAGPKFGFGEDRFAFYLPVGTGFADGVESTDLLQIQPTALFTVPVNPQFELTASGKAILWKDRDVDDLVAINLGAGFGPDLDRWVIRPEGGVLFNPGDEGAFWHLSVGFTYYAGERR